MFDSKKFNWLDVIPLGGTVLIIISSKYRTISMFKDHIRELDFNEAIHQCVSAGRLDARSFTNLCAHLSFINEELNGRIEGLPLDYAHFISEFIHRYHHYIRGTKVSEPESDCVSIW